MKTYQTIKGQSYIVTSIAECDIKGYLEDNTEYLLLTVPANSQGVFVAISSKTVLSDSNSLITPFVDASISVGAGGGISESYLVEKGIIDEWKNVTYTKMGTIGAFYGERPSQLVYKNCSSFILQSSSNNKFNCIQFYCEASDIPTVKINGQNGIYLKNEMDGSDILITYYFETPIMLYPTMEFEIIGCTLGGGNTNNENPVQVKEGLEAGFYPYILFFDYQEEILTGIENSMYKVVATDTDGKITTLAANDTITPILRDYGKFIEAEFVWGSLSPQDTAPTILGFTFMTNKNNEQERMNIYRELEMNYQYTSGGSLLKLIKVR